MKPIRPISWRQKEKHGASTFLRTLILMLAASQACATQVFTTIPQGDYRAVVVALAVNDQALVPVVHRHLHDDSGRNSFAAIVSDVVIELECSVPSILLSSETETLDGSERLCYADGRELRDYRKIIANQWIESKWLGWVVADQYPYVYSMTDGWLFIAESDPGICEIYRFGSQDWQRIDLESENPDKAVKIYPVP